MLHLIPINFYLIIQLWLLANVPVNAYSYHHSHVHRDVHDKIEQWHLEARATGWLRILPLGASITYGTRGDHNTSSYLSHDGYRKPLRDQLRSRGYDVNMIGCVSTGEMRDRQHEGHPGFMIAEIHDKVPCAIDQKPNLVLIHAGTNDCLQGDAKGGASFVQGAQGRMTAMVDEILEQVKDVTVILSTLLPNQDAKANGYVNTVNAGFRQLVSSYQSAGKKVQIADMNTGWIKVSELPDGTHPNDDAYKKMAAVWDVAIEAAAKKGWIKDPINTGKPDSEGFSCDTSPSSFSGATQTQRGSGWDDGTYAHASTPMGVVASDSLHEKGDSATQGQWVKNYHFAQLVNGGGDRGQETDELIRVLDSLNPVADSGLPAFSFKSNTGGKFSSAWTPIDVKQFCNSRGVRWGDVNNDGLDDMICISPNGDMSVSINKGGNPPTFNYIGQVKNAEDTQARVRLGDVDGDGRLDYCVVRGQGDIYCWRNGGTADIPAWEPMVGGVAFDAKSLGDIAGLRFADINGDFRSDLIHVSANGQTRIFINQRGTKEDGGGLKPHWVEASKAHAGGFTGTTVDSIKFGRIYGSGRADYIVAKESNVKDNLGWKHTYSFDVYKNTGSGGRKVKGDGVYYCDMYGRGHDDYLWVFEAGAIHLFENSGNVPNWKQHDEIFNTGRDRRSISFADWDGDSLCDILAVDKHTGAVDWWKNTWTKGQAVPTFAYKGQAVPGNCKYGWGVSRYDLGVRFADIDGDGRDDYLCMDPSGTTSAILNKVDGLRDVGQIKYSVGKDRADHRFVDVDSDGKADFLTVDKFTGDVTVYVNKGEKEKSPTVQSGTGDSSFQWTQQDGFWMDGVDRGANMFFAKMSNSSGRVDFVRNLPASDIAYTYFNRPCKAGGDDPTSSLPLPKPA